MSADVVRCRALAFAHPVASLSVAAGPGRSRRSSLRADGAPRRHRRADRQGRRVHQAAKPPPGRPAPGRNRRAATARRRSARGRGAYEQARQLMLAIDAILQDTAEQRGASAEASRPRRVHPDAAVDRDARGPRGAYPQSARFRARHRHRRARRRDAEEGRGAAPEHPRDRSQYRDAEGKADHGAQGRRAARRANDTVDSLDRQHRRGREAHRARTRTRSPRPKRRSPRALAKSGVELSPEQVDLLLDSVLSGDLVRLVAVFNAAKVIDAQLAQAADRRRRQHELRPQVFRHARGAVRHAGARAGLGHREDRHRTTCRSSTPS